MPYGERVFLSFLLSFSLSAYASCARTCQDESLHLVTAFLNVDRQYYVKNNALCAAKHYDGLYPTCQPLMTDSPMESKFSEILMKI